MAIFRKKPDREPPPSKPVNPDEDVMVILPPKIDVGNIPVIRADRGKVVGYARVSSQEQSLDIQIAQLRAAGCEKIFAEKASGLQAANRGELQKAMAWVREGDVFCVTRLDRFARSMGDMWKMIADLDARGVKLMVLLQPQINTTTPEGRFITGIMAALAEFENDLRRARVKEGFAPYVAKRRIAMAKHVAEQKERTEALKRAGYKPADACKLLGCSRSLLYKYQSGNWLEDPQWQEAARIRYGEAEFKRYMDHVPPAHKRPRNKAPTPTEDES